MKLKKILFLGCGKMGGAIAKNLIKNGLNFEIDAIDPNENQEISEIKFHKSVFDLDKNYKADIIFIAVKPQIAGDVLMQLLSANNFTQNTIFISILAGKKIKFFKEILGKKTKIIRTMPNLPILENKGVFAYYFSKNISSKIQEEMQELFNNFGTIIKLENESKFDRFTAIFGSGPAYIFYLQEIFLKQAKFLQINDENAKKLVEKLFTGSSIMAQNSNFNFSELCNSVASKGGTTEAGIEVLKKNDKLEKIIASAIKSAQKKSKELSK